MMRSRRRWLLAVLTLTFWVVSGPIAMAFDGCSMMGAMCEAPCGPLSYMAAPTVADVTALQPVAYLQIPSTPPPPFFTPGPLTPPPKFALLSA